MKAPTNANQSPDPLPCSICNGVSFTWGGVQIPHTHMMNVYFYPDAKNTLEKIFGGEKIKLIGRMCNTCGHVDWFSKYIPDKK